MYKSYGNDIPLPWQKKLKISIDAVVKWFNVFVTKIKCIEHQIWDPSMRSCKLIFPQQWVILLP